MEEYKTEVLTEEVPTGNPVTTEVIEGEFSPQPPVEEVIESEVVEGEIVKETYEEPFVEPEFITQTFYEEVYNIPEDCVEVAPPSFYRPKWDGEKWIEMGERPADPPRTPTSRELIAVLQEENAALKEENEKIKNDMDSAIMDLTMLISMGGM